jgi:hypothetical protein
MQFRSRDYSPEVTALRDKMESSLRTPSAGAEPQLPALKAKMDAAKAKLEQCERDLEIALDEELTTIANKALDRGDITGAILIAQLSPRSAGQV